jgi:hypothetical protein
MDTLPIFASNQAHDAPSASMPVPRATVRDMCRRRQQALDLFARSFTALSAASDLLDKAKSVFASIDQRSREDRYTHFSKEEEGHFLGGLKLPKLEDFTAAARKMIDRRMWAVLVEITDLERLMDKQAKDELYRQLQENVPEATEDNIFATLQQFVADADMIFKRGIANCFSALDRRFRSHDGWKMGSRVILDRAFSEDGHWSYHSAKRDTLHDIDRTFHVLDGGGSPHLYGGIVSAIERSRRDGQWGARQSECESEYFKIRGFKNGNAHVWFKRDDLVRKVNKLLGEYYGATIPEERDPDPDTGLHTPKTALARNYGFFPTPDAAADKFLEYAPIYRLEGKPPLTVLEPSAGTGNLARRAAERGGIVDCIEYQGALAQQLRNSGLYRKVLCGDFLSVQPNPAALYDRVIMNPPFDRERDIDHVMHALRFLKPDGCLTAIMSAGTEFRETRKAIAFRALMDEMRATWRDLPAASFASVGTYTNTFILRVWNDGRHQSPW